MKKPRFCVLFSLKLYYNNDTEKNRNQDVADTSGVFKPVSQFYAKEVHT